MSNKQRVSLSLENILLVSLSVTAAAYLLQYLYISIDMDG